MVNSGGLPGFQREAGRGKALLKQRIKSQPAQRKKSNQEKRTVELQQALSTTGDVE